MKTGSSLTELATLPEKLRYARKLAGLTLTELSERTGIDTSQLSRFERGERVAGMQVATLVRLARALGQPTGWLAADEGQPAVPVFREPPLLPPSPAPKRRSKTSPRRARV